MSDSDIDIKAIVYIIYIFFQPFTYDITKLVSIILTNKEEENLGLFFGYTKNKFVIFEDKHIQTRNIEDILDTLASYRDYCYYPVFIVYRRESKIYDDDEKNEYNDKGFDEFYKDLCNYYSLDNILINKYKNNNMQ